MASILPIAIGSLLVLGPGVGQAAGKARACGQLRPALSVFESTWQAVRGSFGAAAMPPPRVRFVEDDVREMEVAVSRGGLRQVEISGLQRRALRGEEGCRRQLAARESLIHEFAHVYQAEPWLSGELRANEICEEVPEGLAEAEAQWLMLKVYGLRLGAYDEPVWGTYDAYATQIRREYPKGMIQRGQFGTNWGRDPRAIPWEEPNPVIEAGFFPSAGDVPG